MRPCAVATVHAAAEVVRLVKVRFSARTQHHAAVTVKYKIYFGVQLILLSIIGNLFCTFFYEGGGGRSRNPSLGNYRSQSVSKT